MTNSIRYQYDNHLDSASLELNQIAAIISYEEYHPFGTTSYRSGRTETEVSQKYPHYTSYQYAGNKPVSYIDLDGLEEEKPENIDNTSSNGSPNGMETKRGVNQLKINIDGSTEEIEYSNFHYCKRGKDDPYGKMSVFVFTDGGEAEKFYQFAAFSSTSEWAFAKGKEIKTGGSFSSFVGTNRKEGSTSLIGVFSRLGDIFSKFSHSHANDTNGPTIRIRSYGRNIIDGGDLYAASVQKSNAEYEVLEVTPFVQIGARYVYTKDTYNMNADETQSRVKDKLRSNKLKILFRLE